MTAIADTVTILQGNVAFVNGGLATRLSSDLVTDRDRLTAGTIYDSIAWAYTGKVITADSNLYYHGYEVTIWIRYRLSNPNVEQDLGTPNGQSETLLRALGSREFWLAGTLMSGLNPDVYDLQRATDALTLTAPEREGNIISFSGIAKLLLKQ